MKMRINILKKFREREFSLQAIEMLIEQMIGKVDDDETIYVYENLSKILENEYLQYRYDTELAVRIYFNNVHFGQINIKEDIVKITDVKILRYEN